MNRPRVRWRKPGQPHEFRWSIFLYSLIISAMVMFIFGLLMDNMFRIFGVGISSWFDALWDSLLAALFAFFIAPIFWRIGLVTFPQYILGAYALVVPISIISVLVLSRFHNVGIEVSGVDPDAFPNQFIAITAYVRLIRSMIFVPIFLATFYWTCHVLFGMSPKQKNDTAMH